jgi:uncharacterized protein YlzI (FlbEa/FlbD family)
MGFFIELTAANRSGRKIVVNACQIVSIQACPKNCRLLTMSNGSEVNVKETLTNILAQLNDASVPIPRSRSEVIL